MVNPDTNSGKAAFAAALTAVAVGGTVLAGWFFDLERLKRVVPGLIAMNPVTAVAFIFAGVSLACFLRSARGGVRAARASLLTARGCALLVALIGLAKLAGILGGWSHGIDQWLFPSKLADGLGLPNRMAPNTALNFLLLGSALVLVDVKNRSARFYVEFAAVIIGLVSLLAVLGYVYVVQPLYRFGSFVPMALHTALAFSILSVGLLLSHTDSGLLAMFAGDSRGGKLARRLLPAAVFVPALFGWLSRLADNAGIYSPAFCDAVEVVANILVFTFLICWSARNLFHADNQRKEAEQATRESEETFALAFEQAPIGVALLSPDGRWLKVNPALCDLVGYPEAELLARTFRDLTPPGEIAAGLETVRRLVTGETRSCEFQKHYVHRRGHLVAVSIHASLVRDGQGQPRYFIAQTQDITERERAATALRESEERHRALIEWSPEPIAVQRDGILLFVNSAAVRMIGATSARDLVGKSFLDLVHPDSRRNVLERRKTHAANGGGAIPRSEEKFVRLDGTVIDVETQGTLIVYDGEPAVYLSMRDVTGRKRAEESLRLLGAAVEQSTESIMITDAQLDLPGPKIVFVNPALTRMSGYAAEEVLGKTPRMFQGPQTDRKVLDRLRRNLAAGEIFAGVTCNYRKDGSEFVLEWQIAPIREANGTITHFVAVERDTTERARSEALLLESQQRLALATESAGIGIWDWNVVEDEMVWDARMLVLYGLCPQDFSGAVDAWQKGLHPADRARAEAEIAAALAGTRDFRSEFRVVWPGGEVHEIQAHGVVQRSPDGSPRRMIGVNWDVTARKRTEARYRRLVESNVQGIFFWTATGGITGTNDAFLSLTGYSRQDLEAGRIDWVALTPPEYADIDRRVVAEIAAKGTFPPYEKEFIRKDGTRVPILVGAAAFEDNPEEGVCFVLDLTERKRLETQLIQSQKLETVGKLAGGIAHEFNSILTVIIGQGERLLSDLPAGSPLVTNATEITKAAGRAATLTRQLLAYGRKQLLQPEALDLNQIITSMEGVFRHLMGGGIATRIVSTPGLHAVKADAAQLEQVIMNMAINARDAMPKGGQFTLETANVSFDQESVNDEAELKRGDYVMLAITDTGTGMSAEVKERLFEPFFSTKGVGKGTGLGLSTCYGIVKQSGGHISVSSEVARGTVFKIYLPQVEQPAKAPVTRVAPPNLPGGTETILLVEDDSALREMAASLLRRLGYTVLAAADGIEALSLKQQRDNGPIDLLCTDIVMPRMSGKELAERVLALSPHTRILFTSAYTENAIFHQEVLNKEVAILQKPFLPSVLAHKLREVLDQPGDGWCRTPR